MTESENTLAESEWYGRVNMAESENTLAESPWPNPNIMAESHALVAAVRNLAYHQHYLVLGTSNASAHAWLGAHRCPEQPRLGARGCLILFEM